MGKSLRSIVENDFLIYDLNFRFMNKENNIYVDECSVGKGVFAKRNLAKGEKILEFVGPVVTLDKISNLNIRDGDPLQIGKKEYMVISKPALYVNHSCNPNAGIIGNVDLIAIKEIKQREEIQFDYSTTMDEDLWTMKCKCQSKNCRRIIKDFKYLPKRIRDKYIKMGIVQDFIIKRYKL